MSPKNGDTKIEDGLRWVYEDPPGEWTFVTPQEPLVDRDKDLGDLLDDL